MRASRYLIEIDNGLGRSMLARAALAGWAFLLLVAVSMPSHAAELSIHYPEPCPDEPPFVATISWEMGEEFSGRIEIRVGSPTGNLFTTGHKRGEATTGSWVQPGMGFYLINAADSSVLNEVEASLDDCRASIEENEEPTEAVPEPSRQPSRQDEGRTTEPPVSGSTPISSSGPPAILGPRGSIKLDKGEFLKLSPPRLRYCGQPVERAMIRVLWDVTALGEEHAEVFIGSVDGQVLARGAATGEVITGEWVTHGMRFLLYLPDSDEVVAEKEFRILPCNVAEYPDEPAED